MALSQKSSDEYVLFTKKILILIVIAGILWIAYTLSSLIWMILISGFLAILLNPLVNLGRRKHIPTWLTVIVVYLTIIFLSLFIIGTLIPIIIESLTKGINQFTNWLENIQNIYLAGGIGAFDLPVYIEQPLNFFMGENKVEGVLRIIQQNAEGIQSFLTNQAKNITSGTINIGSSVIGFLSSLIFTGIITFLMVIERKALGNLVLEIMPENIANYFRERFGEIEFTLTAWIRGQLILCFSIFLTTFIGLVIIEWVMGVDLKNVGFLALIAGIMEFIPYVGPFIALIPAAVIALGIGWEILLIILIFYIVVQQLENNLFVPLIMSKSLDLSPLYILVIMLAGGMLGGVIGILLATPFAALFQIFFLDSIKWRKGREINFTKNPITPTRNPAKKTVIKK